MQINDTPESRAALAAPIGRACRRIWRHLDPTRRARLEQRRRVREVLNMYRRSFAGWSMIPLPEKIVDLVPDADKVYAVGESGTVFVIELENIGARK